MTLLTLLLVSGGAACSRKQPSSDATATSAARYIVMEKVLSDVPGRPRTTMKILIPDRKDRQAVSAALTQSLADTRRDDPSLSAVIIWAYRSRAELNGSNFTAGKLEWSSDGKDFAGQNKMDSNPKIEAIAP